MQRIIIHSATACQEAGGPAGKTGRGSASGDAHEPLAPAQHVVERAEGQHVVATIAAALDPVTQGHTVTITSVSPPWTRPPGPRWVRWKTWASPSLAPDKSAMNSNRMSRRAPSLTRAS